MESQAEVRARQEEREAAETQKKEERQLPKAEQQTLEKAKTNPATGAAEHVLKNSNVPSAAALDVKRTDKTRANKQKVLCATAASDSRHLPQAEEDVPHTPLTNDEVREQSFRATSVIVSI
eukprot:TRINITY_DN109011_c0_g1_i1.p1 TRINITY_DN109011_c0_g1~~TRINITY_DN109011_c0_g1_i1.p1  ORF type:complete len:121 (+),score=32.79 TRINITY_DN109011_c0_g1_i1:383-745(+)